MRAFHLARDVVTSWTDGPRKAFYDTLLDVLVRWTNIGKERSEKRQESCNIYVCMVLGNNYREDGAKMESD